MSRISTIRSTAYQETQLGLVLEEKATVPSIPKPDKRVEFGLGFSDELLRTSMMVLNELMKQSCPSPNTDLILRETLDVQRVFNADCSLPDLNTSFNLMTTASRRHREKNVELSGCGPENWVKPDSCMAKSVD